MSAVREHTGHGWGDPLDGSKPEIWLCNGYVCVYSPEHPNRVELWTANGPCDSRFAFTNAGKDANDDAVNHARAGGIRWTLEYLGANCVGSRFD